MALWDRISRVLASFRQKQLDERELVGIQGEEYATEIIAGVNPQCHIANAVVPSANGRYCETDHVVLVGGTVFIVEVKNYKGRLVWEDAGERGLMHWKPGTTARPFFPILPGIRSRRLAVTFGPLRPTSPTDAIGGLRTFIWNRSGSLLELPISRLFTVWTKD